MYSPDRLRKDVKVWLEWFRIWDPRIGNPESKPLGCCSIKDMLVFVGRSQSSRKTELKIISYNFSKFWWFGSRKWTIYTTQKSCFSLYLADLQFYLPTKDGRFQPPFVSLPPQKKSLQTSLPYRVKRYISLLYLLYLIIAGFIAIDNRNQFAPSVSTYHFPKTCTKYLRQYVK